LSFEILDLSASLRNIWFDKGRAGVLWIDLRPEIKPGVVADDCRLPLASAGPWHLVVFDPPHRQISLGHRMNYRYGSMRASDLHSFLPSVAAEAWRVTTAGALMAFKWSNVTYTVDRALGELADYWEPLFGHGFKRSGRSKSLTSWAMLKRRETRREVKALDAL
jgi:hypothetical protein